VPSRIRRQVHRLTRDRHLPGASCLSFDEARAAIDAGLPETFGSPETVLKLVVRGALGGVHVQNVARTDILRVQTHHETLEEMFLRLTRTGEKHRDVRIDAF